MPDACATRATSVTGIPTTPVNRLNAVELQSLDNHVVAVCELGCRSALGGDDPVGNCCHGRRSHRAVMAVRLAAGIPASIVGVGCVVVIVRLLRPWSFCSVTTLGNTFAATCSSGATGTLIADRPPAELGTNNWLPMVGGWTRIAAAAPIAAEKTATARPHTIKVPMAVSLRRPLCCTSDTTLSGSWHWL